MQWFMDIPDINILKGNFLGKLYIQKHYPKFYQYLLDTYRHIPIKKFSEYLYLYYHNMTDRPKCKCCDNKANFIDFTHGYRTYCSVKCQTNDPDIILKGLKKKEERYGKGNLSNNKKAKQTKLERYGDPNYNNMGKNRQTCLERYGVEHPIQSNEIKERMIETCIERYGVNNPMKNKEIAKRSIKNKIIKYGVDNVSNQKKTRQTCQERYGVDNISLLPEMVKKIESTKLEKYGDKYYSNREKAKQTMIEKYGVENVIVLSEIQDKIYKTKRKRKTFVLSSIELQFKKWLDEHKIKYIYQYKSKEYPFNCDFYFPDVNLYLEIQGNWVHGKHPYNEHNIDDYKLLQKWINKNTSYYIQAIQTWTIRDPQKRQWAKDHDLNWKEVFTYKLDELIEQVKDIIL